MNIFQSLFKRKAASVIDPGFTLAWAANGWAIYPTNQKNYIQKGFKGNGTVYSVISKMASKFSTVPFYLYKVKNEQAAKRYNSITGQAQFNIGAMHKLMVLKEQAYDEVTTSPLIDLLERPNPSQNESDFRNMVMRMKATTGAAPIYANKGISGDQVRSLYCLPTDFMQLWPDESLNHIAKAALNITGLPSEIPIEQLYYWKYNDIEFSTTGQHLYGLSPLQASWNKVKADNDRIEAMGFMFKNKGATGLFVPKDAAGVGPINNGPGGSDRLRTTLDELISTRDGKTARPFINAPLDYITFGMDSQELELIKAGEMTKEDFCNMYDFPTALLSLKNSTDNNYQNAIKYLVTNTIYADLVGYRDMVNQWLMPMMGMKGFYYDFDLSELTELQEDIAKLSAWLKDAWFITPNEKRSALKYDKLLMPEFDEPFIPSGLQPLSIVLEGNQNMPITPDYANQPTTSGNAG